MKYNNGFHSLENSPCSSIEAAVDAECSEIRGVYLGLNSMKKPATEKEIRSSEHCPKNHHGKQPPTPDRLETKANVKEKFVCQGE